MIGAMAGLISDRKHQAMLEADMAGATLEDYANFLFEQAKLRKLNQEALAALAKTPGLI